MPRATLTFKLPEEEHDFRDAQDGIAFRSVLRDLDLALRTRTKHGYDRRIKTPKQAYQEIRDLLNQALVDDNLVLFR